MNELYDCRYKVVNSTVQRGGAFRRFSGVDNLYVRPYTHRPTRAYLAGTTLQEDDLRASGRLKDAVSEAFGKPAKVRNPNQLAGAAKLSRSTLDGYLKEGIQPSTENMRRIAEALGVTAESLWLRWLGYEPPEPGLSRIAEEISELRRALRGTDLAETAESGVAEGLRRHRARSTPPAPGKPAQSPPRRPRGSGAGRE